MRYIRSMYLLVLSLCTVLTFPIPTSNVQHEYTTLLTFTEKRKKKQTKNETYCITRKTTRHSPSDHFPSWLSAMGKEGARTRRGYDLYIYLVYFKSSGVCHASMERSQRDIPKTTTTFEYYFRLCVPSSVSGKIGWEINVRGWVWCLLSPMMLSWVLHNTVCTESGMKYS